MFKTIPTLSQEVRTEVDTDGDGIPDRFEVDTDGNGTIDRIEFDPDQDGNIDRITHYAYDDDGNRIRAEIDFGADGNINLTRFDDDADGNFDRIEAYTYNSDGTRIRIRFDDDADGNFDRSEIDFDADGNINQTRFDGDDDGTNDRTEAYIYDDDGNRTRTRFDDDNDGTNDRIEAYTYNSDGNRTRTRFDDDADGNFDRSEFDFDADGNIDRIAFDTDGDGTNDRIEAYTYNGDGNRTRTRFDDDNDGNFDRSEFDFDVDGNIDRIAFDTDGDGTIDRSEAYTYNGDGNRTRTRFDDDNDGNFDRSETDFDADGNIDHIRFDDDDDGTNDRTEFYTYNSDGDLIRTRFDDDADGNFDRSEFDDDADGTTDRSEAYSYDDDGNRTRTRFDDDNDGNFDRSEFDFDADGNINQTRFDDDDDGTNDRTEFYTYNSDGDLIRTRFDDDADGLTDRTEFDDDADGTADRSETYTYNANGRVSQTDFDDDANGTTDRSEFYTYNPDGRVSRTDFDDDANGTIDRSERALSILDGTNGFIPTGIDENDYSGFSVSSAGDVNGDGYDDLIIGAYRADPNGNNSAGETYIVYGGASAPGTEGVLDLGALDGTNGFILTGIDADDHSGRSVSSAGDVNGDGYDDLIIGARFADPNGELGAGETYLVYGGASAPGTGGVLDLGALNGTNGFILTGIEAYDFSAFSVSSAGDVNGDGYDDLIIGAFGADPNGDIDAGETYVVYGGASAPGTDGVLDLGALDGTNGFILNGIDADDWSGWSVSSAGDVNGDGYDDLIIGAYRADPNGNNSAGETYIVYGGASAPGTEGVLDLGALDGTNGFILTGIDADDHSGRSVSSAGDVNGDGYDDLIIGAWFADPNGDSQAGETYIVYGAASAPGTDGVLDLSTLDGTNGFILTGIDAGDGSGRSVSSAGDVNGDGYDDLIIGADGADPNGDSAAGETYLVYGGASAPGTGGVLDLGALNGTNGFILTGIDFGDQSGFSVSSAGDVNGDGYDDLIIGARSADPNGITDAGETYIVYGGATGTESLVPVTAQGTAAADNFTGNAGDDSFAAIATNDVVRGGAGDDMISVTALDFAAVDGGTGQDTLVLAGAGLTLDLTGTGHAGVDSVEVFDLSGTGANSLVLDALAVFDVTEERESGVAGLDVLGDADDRVELTQSVGRPFVRIGQEAEDGVTYIVYSDGNAQVRVETGVQVQIPVTTIPVFTSPPAAASVAEGQSAVYRAAATDADGDMLRYSLSGTDAALFTIGSTTGEVRFRAAPDFEDPADADGDNVYDITVTASDGTNSTNHNIAITVTDEENDLIPLSSLDGTNGFTLTGIDADDRSGFSVSSAGDVNGDGYDDLIIGARWADPNGDSRAGETYVVYGGASAPGIGGVLDLGVLDRTNGFILTGVDAYDNSGFSVSSAGDVNGDGYDDLIIGAYRADPNEDSAAGETYIVYGGASAPGTDGVLDLGALDGTNGFTLTGIDAGDQSGRSVSSAGDVNGDGYDDLIIGAYRADPNGNSSAGETYVVYGGASAPGTNGVLDLSDLDGTNGFTLNGIDRSDNSGISVSLAGDVNGDGYDDLIIGAYRANPNGFDSGETYVVYGGASAPGTDGVLDLSDLDGTNGFTLNGIDAIDNSGISVSLAGDVNGDGYDDLIIGAYRADPNGISNAGETYIVYGGASAPGTDGVLDLSDLDGTNGFTLTGIDVDDESGWSVSSAGDVNGDGYDDLIIGAYRADPNGDIDTGETYVIYGGASAPGTGGVLDLLALNGTNGFILTGIDTGDYSGWSVSSAGDVNGDGYDDLIIGSPEFDLFERVTAGETYIVYGGATGTESLTPVTAQGTAAADNFTGNAGADSFTAIATDDVVRGGAGDDRISVTALDFAAIDGGTGQDTLVLAGVGLALDLTGAGHAGVDSVEVFDLSGTGANSLVLDALTVFDVTEEREGGVASLDVLGDADDRVDLSGSSFALTGTATEDGVTYNVYRDGNAQLRIEDGVMVTLAAAGSQSARSKIDTKTDTGIDPVADPRTDPGTGTIRLDNPLMNPDPLMNNDLWNNDLWNNDLWDGLWTDGVRNLDQPVHIDEDAILIPLSDPLSFSPLASGPLPGPWGDLIYWPGLGSHPAMQNDLAMILPEMEIVTAYMEGF